VLDPSQHLHEFSGSHRLKGRSIGRLALKDYGMGEDHSIRSKIPNLAANCVDESLWALPRASVTSGQ
jgi:hypothetical protein